MRKTQVDYRELRLHNLNSPRFRHLYLLLGWIVYFAAYYLTENRIPIEKCHLIHVPLDDRIPLCEWFVLFYVGWYLLIVLSLGYFLLYHIEYFRALQTYIIIVQALATAVYILYPSYQDLRPEVFPRENVFTAILGILYRIDTPTGICPSLHVAVSVAIASCWLRLKTVKLWIRGAIALFCLGVCLSVAFVKQHSVVDILAAVPICLIAEWLVFFRRLHS